MFSLRYYRCIAHVDKHARSTSKSRELSRTLFSSFCKHESKLLRGSVRQPGRGHGFRSNTGPDKPTRHKSLAPVEQVPGDAQGFRALLKPFVFSVVVSASSFAAAAIWQYENMRHVAVTQINPNNTNKSAHSYYSKAGDLRRKLNVWWNNLLPGQKVGVAIISLNTAVFLMWRVPRLGPFMAKYFMSSPMSGAVCSSMLLSAFSHYSFVHLFVNMYVLWSFIPIVSKIYGNEQFVATYMTAAMASGFTGYLYKILRRSMIPSVGASGAIMAMIGTVCVMHPQAQLSIAFVDQIIPHSFSADSAMKCLIIFDTLGVLLGFRFFDHAAHLGGMLFGIWYVKYGHQMIWKKREPLMRRWHALRGKP